MDPHTPQKPTRSVPRVDRPLPPMQRRSMNDFGPSLGVPAKQPAPASPPTAKPIQQAVKTATAAPPPMVSAPKPTEIPANASSAQPEAAKKPSTFVKVLRAVLSLIVFVAFIVGFAWLINVFIFQSYYVDGTSMTPTLQNNDRLIIDKVERTWAHIAGSSYLPKRGQIVVLDSSLRNNDGSSEQLIKRVIGLPGDTITISGGVVTIRNSDNPNGFNVDQTLGLHLAPTYVDGGELTVTVPENSVYVMGDNRAQGGSYDSRIFGPISSDKIEGRLWARILPLNKSGIF